MERAVRTAVVNYIDIKPMTHDQEPGDINRCSGVAGRKGGGSKCPDPPELSSGVHAKRKNPLRIFFVEGGGRG